MDHRKLPRRRGEELLNAIYTATLAELAESGYAALTVDRVAKRAHTSKASMYRRWPSKVELVIDAVYRNVRDALVPPDTGDLRQDALALLRQCADLLAGPRGDLVRGLIPEVLRNPELGAARARIATLSDDPMLTVLRRAADRGAVRPSAVTPRVAGVATALVREHFLLHDAPIPDEVIVEIVDQVLLPLVHQ
ncbi:TetR/AcrR family transcriptional regulator [Actinophytocola sediminis]